MILKPEWNRFGADDVLGALNYISKEKILEAVSLVRYGEVIPLNLPLNRPKVHPGGRPPMKLTTRQYNQLRPFGNRRYLVANDDIIEFALQGSTHWDSFAHCGLIEPDVDGIFYGGAGLEETTPEPRAKRLGIDAFSGGIITRGILLDIVEVIEGPKAEYLPPETILTRDVIEKCLEAQSLELKEGDAVLFYTGCQQMLAHQEDEFFPESTPGLDSSSLTLWRDAKIAALATDSLTVDATYKAKPRDYSAHIGALRNLGIPCGDLWALEELAKRVKEDRIYEFLLVSVPLNAPGAFASPANAVAIR